MTFRLDVIASLTDAGKPGRPNEDRLGSNRTAAFVVDGATGLGDRQFMSDYGSDAAWIADYAARRMAVELTPDVALPDLLARISADARAIFDATAGEQPRYAWPLAALAGLRVTEDGLEFFGLGDSVVYLLHDDGRTDTFTALPDAFAREQAAARRHVERVGGIGASGAALGDPETLEELRRNRERQNTPDGWVWSLGLVPEAAEHLARQPIPVTGGATAVICSDGLADLVSLYQTCDAGTLVRRAVTAGLQPLVTELRHLEREVDPDGLKYPRFKQCDDTTAVLVRVEG
ncbi:serine/threonine protein phosphatase PrpC [Neorhizobium galegae]|uniref:protein phosphatase 2C domain-containing protein n=1 Tax=Neorhizobium galegae TaxID=399 RepID=UPI001AE86F5A|nr:protein phosphatase 2C domain-containing protein [Neorhizobium galegae]MBP2548987.1 serine/threonine protein phosphatase PrpC [Neorhizobium galegae]